MTAGTSVSVARSSPRLARYSGHADSSMMSTKLAR
jgi:hypothetical protein